MRFELPDEKKLTALPGVGKGSGCHDIAEFGAVL